MNHLLRQVADALVPVCLHADELAEHVYHASVDEAAAVVVGRDVDERTGLECVGAGGHAIDARTAFGRLQMAGEIFSRRSAEWL